MLDAQDLLGRIRVAFRAGHYEVSRHAALRMLRRAIHTEWLDWRYRRRPEHGG